MGAEPPLRPPGRERVNREVKDILLKRLAALLRGKFPSLLGLDLPAVVAVLSNELPVLEVRAEYPDLVLLLADGSILHIEFQLRPGSDDLPRFYRYHYALSETHGVPVYTVVIYGPGVSQAPTRLDRGSVQYEVRNVYLGQTDGEVVVARLRAKAAAGERWTAQDQMEAVLLPLMGRQRPLSVVLREVVEASAILPSTERTQLLGSMVGLAYNYLEPAVAEQLLEVLRMSNALEEMLVDRIMQGIEEGRAKGMAEGRVEGRVEGLAEGVALGQRDAVRKVLERRFGSLPSALAERLDLVRDPQQLGSLLELALDAESLDVVEHSLPR